VRTPTSLDEGEATDHNGDFHRAEDYGKQHGGIRQEDRATTETDQRDDCAEVIGYLAVPQQQTANDH
jgi:hypothetical protein